jgi:outer membrane immunogenic protein
MKKLFILGIGLSLSALTLSTQAQTTTTAASTEGATRFGIKAGANLMMAGKFDVAGTDYTSKYMAGYQAGFFAEIPLGGSFSFMPEVLYSRKGGKFDETIGGTNGVIETKIGYIDVPVLFSYNATPALNFVLGPQVSFFTDQDTETSVNGTVTATSNDGDNFRKSIAGGVVGIGYRLTPNLNLNGRYNMDFQSTSNDDINQDKARLSGFALSLGYAF